MGNEKHLYGNSPIPAKSMDQTIVIFRHIRSFYLGEFTNDFVVTAHF